MRKQAGKNLQGIKLSGDQSKSGIDRATNLTEADLTGVTKFPENWAVKYFPESWTMTKDIWAPFQKEWAALNLLILGRFY